MKKIALAVAAACLGLIAASPAWGGQDKVTLCHAAGLAGTTQYVEITVGYPAAYGPAGHFEENGTPRAGHEQDYLGPCVQTPPPPSPVCPEGYAETGRGDGYILCTRTIQTPGPERIIYVTREVPGPERVVEVVRTIEVPGPERIVEKPVTVTKVVTKVKRVVKTRTIVKWKTKVVVKKVPVVGVCRIPGTKTAAVQGNG